MGNSTLMVCLIAISCECHLGNNVGLGKLQGLQGRVLLGQGMGSNSPTHKIQNETKNMQNEPELTELYSKYTVKCI